MSKRFFIQTVGCQMNTLDSELVAASLMEAGYEAADRLDRADLILFNTCSVRQHAEDKVYSALGRLRTLKQDQPDKILGVMGCMAQKDQQQIFKRAPYVDLVVGPGQIRQLPELIQRIASGAGPQLEISLDRKAAGRNAVRQSFDQFDPQRSAVVRPARHQAMVRIMFGCDQFCTFCIVPSVRGPEQSRPAAEIEREVRILAEQGCLEVTLLGQTVNSYHDESQGGSTGLADLLYRLHEVPGLARLRFVTSHPEHMSQELIHAVRDLPKVCPYFHVPAQSGSNRMLQRMHRGYSVEEYRDMLARIRQAVPQAAITSDFIVGFCGESDDDFRQTVDLVRDARFKNSFIFKYSQREGTVAARLYPDDVPEDVKRQRNNALLAVQDAICLEDNQSWVGRTAEILVEGPSKVGRKRRDRGQPVQLTGRTRCDRIVVFEGPPQLIGRILEVRVQRVDAFTLFARCEPESDGNSAQDRAGQTDSAGQRIEFSQPAAAAATLPLLPPCP